MVFLLKSLLNSMHGKKIFLMLCAMFLFHSVILFFLDFNETQLKFNCKAEDIG